MGWGGGGVGAVVGVKQVGGGGGWVGEVLGGRERRGVGIVKWW